MDKFLGAFTHFWMFGLLIDVLCKQIVAFQMVEESRHEVIG